MVKLLEGRISGSQIPLTRPKNGVAVDVCDDVERIPRDEGGHEGKNDQQTMASGWPNRKLFGTHGAIVLRSARDQVGLANKRRICYAFARGSSNVHSCDKGSSRR